MTENRLRNERGIRNDNLQATEGKQKSNETSSQVVAWRVALEMITMCISSPRRYQSKRYGVENSYGIGILNPTVIETISHNRKAYLK